METQEKIFKAMQEVQTEIGRFSPHHKKSVMIKKKNDLFNKVAIKYGVKPDNLKNIYFGSR